MFLVVSLQKIYLGEEIYCEKSSDHLQVVTLCKSRTGLTADLIVDAAGVSEGGEDVAAVLVVHCDAGLAGARQG